MDQPRDERHLDDLIERLRNKFPEALKRSESSGTNAGLDDPDFRRALQGFVSDLVGCLSDQAPEDQRSILAAVCHEHPGLADQVTQILDDDDATRDLSSSSRSTRSEGEEDDATRDLGAPKQQHISHYRLVCELGKGGMGVVYLARDEALHRDVAIKTIPSRLLADRDAVKRLQREARIIAQLQHPNIAQIHHLLTEDDQIYLILEYVPGRTLEQRLRSDGPMGVDEAFAMATQLAGAIEAAHARGVVHRDLKPANLIWADDQRLKVLDYGLAIAPPPETFAGQTEPDEAFITSAGTPGYLPPEQATGGVQTPACDIFALGCTLFEVLAGQRPFPALQTLTGTLPDPPDTSVLPGALPETFVQVLQRCLAEDPRERPTIHDVLSACVGVNPAPSANDSRRHVFVTRGLPSMIGRDAEAATLDSLIQHNPLVTIVGPAGCGKTRLAVNALEYDGSRFPGGTFAIDLAPLRADVQIWREIILTLTGTSPATEPSLDEVAHALPSDPFLLMLDNCEHVAEVIRATADHLIRSSDNGAVLATSREPLALPNEQILRLDTLPTPAHDDDDLEQLRRNPAVALFVERAASRSEGFALTSENADCIARICRRLDGLPLAIELAAARSPSLSPAQIEARIDRRFGLLRAPRGTAVEHHKTLQTAVDWSYALLAESTQRVFRCLGLFNGSFGLEAVLAVLSGAMTSPADEFETLDALADLIDKSMVMTADAAGEVRYRLLETMRDYARDQLSSDECLERASDAYIAHYLNLAQQSFVEINGPRQGRWLDRLEETHANVLAAIDLADPNQRAAFCAALGPFWIMRGHAIVARDTALDVLAGIGENDVLSVDQARTATTAATAIWRLGDLDHATTLFERALTSHKAQAEVSGAAGALANLAAMALLQKDFGAARARLLEAIRLNRQHGHDQNAAIAWNNLGVVYIEQGRLSRASRALTKSLQLHRSLENPWWIALNLHNLGSAARKAARLDEARTMFRESLAIRRSLGDESALAQTLDELAIIAHAEADADVACRALRQADALRGKLNLQREPQEQVEYEDVAGVLAEHLNRRDAASESLSAFLNDVDRWLAT